MESTNRASFIYGFCKNENNGLSENEAIDPSSGYRLFFRQRAICVQIIPAYREEFAARCKRRVRQGRTGCEGVGHEGRQHDDNLQIPVRMNATGGKPVAQFIIVPGIRVDDSETQGRQTRVRRSRMTARRAAPVSLGSRLPDAPLTCIACQSVFDTVTIASEAHGHGCPCWRGKRRQAEIAGNRHWRQHVCRL